MLKHSSRVAIWLQTTAPAITILCILIILYTVPH